MEAALIFIFGVMTVGLMVLILRTANNILTKVSTSAVTAPSASEALLKNISKNVYDMAHDEEIRSSLSNLELYLRFIKDDVDGLKNDVDGLRNDGRLEDAGGGKFCRPLFGQPTDDAHDWPPTSALITACRNMLTIRAVPRLL